MNIFKSIVDAISNFFAFVGIYFKEKNRKEVQVRKELAADEKFKNIAKVAIKKRDIKKVRDFLSE